MSTPDADGQQFLLAGMSRIAVRVARLLVARGGEVTVLASAGDEDLTDALPDEVKVVEGDAADEDALVAGGLRDAECLLVLGEDDHQNLRTVAAASETAPGVPVVLRAFDARLAEQLEVGLNVRRCYSASALAAPAFVAAIFAESVVETLRIGPEEVPLCILKVTGESPLADRSYGQMKRDWHCAAIAIRCADGEWEPALGDDGTIRPGTDVLVGGLLVDVLGLALKNREKPHAPRRVLPKLRREHAKSTTPAARSLVPAATVALIILLALTAGVFAAALDTGPADAVYRAITNAFGDVGLSGEDSWLKIFGVATMVSGALLVGILFTHLTAMFTANRIEERAGRHARRMHDHVVVAGLGSLGFRVERLLDDLGVPTVVVERDADSRFREAAAMHSPVLSGDIRLAENLERASIERAQCLIACTDDELTNVAACVQARMMNPGLRTVARIFDDDLARRLGGFGIDVIVSQSAAAAGAFVGAATDDRAARHLELGALSLTALRHTVDRTLDADELTAWRNRGVRIAAVQLTDQTIGRPTRAGEGLDADSTVIVAGPDDVVGEFIGRG